MTPFTTCEWANNVIPPQYIKNNKGRKNFIMRRNLSKNEQRYFD